MPRWPAFLLCILLTTACAVSVPGAQPAAGNALEGRWGGAHAELLLSSTGGSIEYDCATGMLDAAVVPDANGRFLVPGRHVRGQGGPVRLGEQWPSQPASYAGRVEGDRMQLRVRLDTGTLGPFTLQRGVDAQLFKCL